MRHLAARSVVLALVASLGCSQGPRLEQRHQEILDLHRSLIQAHWDKDAAALASPTADGYLAVAVGEVRAMSAADVETMLGPYLEETEFSHYEDVADPIVGFSDDGSLAWTIVQVRVAGSRTGDEGVRRSFDTRWAWLTLYRRVGNGWQRIVDVSTNRPFEAAPE